jgi:hypothetical protein
MMQMLSDARNMLVSDNMRAGHATHVLPATPLVSVRGRILDESVGFIVRSAMKVLWSPRLIRNCPSSRQSLPSFTLWPPRRVFAALRGDGA